jgi:uncharacterized repeat protein (TIGR01451 family)/uncharacterized repeat protein (TIGR02543 family)
MVFSMSPWAQVQTAYAEQAASSTEAAASALSTEAESEPATTSASTQEQASTAAQSSDAATAAAATSDDAATATTPTELTTQSDDSAAQSSAPVITTQGTDGETYTKGTAKVTGVNIVAKGSTETTGNIVVEAGSNPGETLTSTVTIGEATKSASSVWVAFKITVPKTLPSGGAVNITSGSILDMANGTATATATDDGNGNWVLTGRTLAVKADGSNVVPGSFSSDYNIGVSSAAAGETLQVTEEAWLYTDGEDNAQTGTRTIEYTTTPKYDTQSATFNNTSSNTSGWYNATTHVFQTTKPDDTTGWTYGRVWALTSAVVDKGNERLDPTKPITWNITTKVQTTANNVTVDDTTAANQPVLLGIKSADPAVTTSQLGPVSDMTLGGVITPTDFYNYQTLSYKGDNSPDAYTFTQSGQTVTPKVTLSSSKAATWDAAEVYAEYFVPAVSDPTGTTRTFVVTHDSLTATSYAGTTVNDSDATDNTYSYVVPPKADYDVSGIFTRLSTFEKLNTGNAITETNNGDTVDIRNTIKFQFDTSTIPDYNINAINILAKIPAGIEATSDEARTTTNYKDSSGNEIKPTTLYAVKADKTGWASEYEMNHTQDYQLRYYDTLDAAKDAGTVVGILYEWRGGTWTSSSNIVEAVKSYKVNSDAGVFLPTVQDVRVWRGGTTLTTADTWSGTDGAAVSEDTWGADTKAHKDLMLPYDDAENTSGVYEKDTWDDTTGAPKRNEGHTWGDTVYVMGGTLANNSTTTKQLNGTDIRKATSAWNESWPTATYDIGSNQRTVDRVFGFTVSGAGTTSLNLKADLDTETAAYYEKNTSKVARTGVAYLSTSDNPVTYTPNANPALGGTFSGGTIIDPSNFTVPGDGEYQIYYTDTIGDATDLANDAVSGTTYLNFCNVDPAGDSTKLLNDKATPVCFNTYVTRTSVSGLSKKASSDYTFNSPSWDSTVDTTTAAMGNLYVLDVLPYNGDANGTKLSGSYAVSGLTATTSAASGTSASSAFAVYYTTDTAVRSSYDASAFSPSTTAPSTRGDTFTANGVSWTKATDNGNGSWSVPDGTTAIMACSDSLAASERFNLHVALSLTGAEKGDVLYNASSYCYYPQTTAVVTPPAGVSVVSRTVSGIAWVDNDGDGVYDATKGDTLLSGVNVALYKADGTQVTKDTNGVDYSVTTATDGSYAFANVPENADGYYVAFSGTALGSYSNTTKSTAAPDASATDSDINAKADGAYKTDVFTTKTDDELIAAGLAGVDVTGVNGGFVPTTFTVSYDYGTAPASASALPASATHSTGDSVTVAAAATAPGYTFSGWSDASTTSPVTISNGSFTMPARNVTLTGTWTPKTYTVKYDTNGGTPATIADKTDVKWSDSSLLPAEPTKAGFTFAGWQVSDGGTAGTVATATSKYSDLATDDSTTSITLKAVWTADADVTINYKSADTSTGTVDPASESLNPETGSAAGSTATAKDGYHFVSWTNASGDVVSTDASYVPAKVNGLNVAATYTANFKANGYTIHFDPNATDATGSTADEAMTFGTAADLTANGFDRPGYTFGGWNTKADNTGTSYSDKANVSDLTTVDGATVTLYAVWTQDSNVVISYKSADATMGTVDPGSESLAPATGVAAGSTATAKDGYEFVSWTNASGDVVSTDASYVPAKVNGLNVAATYTANFKAKEYTVSFDTDGGTPATIDSIEVTKGTVIVKDGDWASTGGTAPTKDGYVFGGWQVVSAGSGLTVGSILSSTDVMPASDVALKAIWTVAPSADVVVTKSVSSGTAKPGDTVTYTIVATNNGNADAVGYWVKDYVPDNTTYETSDGIFGATNAGKQFASWFFDSIAPGDSKTMTLTVKVAECQDGTGVDNVALGQNTGSTTPPADVAGTDPSGTTSNKASFTVSNPNAPAQGVTGTTSSTTQSSTFLPTTGDGSPVLPIAVALSVGLAAIAVGVWRRKNVNR